MRGQCTQSEFLSELARCREMTDQFLLADRYHGRFEPAHMRDAVYSYLERSGKRLRPAVLLMCCRLFGGSDSAALPAAAAVELFHTWTLVHDDVIDNDNVRRGQPTVHSQAEEWAKNEFGAGVAAQQYYGRDVAILAGDIQQGWANSILLECAREHVSPDVVLYLVERMNNHLLCRLIEGEMLDVQFSYLPLSQISESEVLRMLELKTGVLLEYAAMAGACIGMDMLPDKCPEAIAVAEFARKCGIAFQLQDDILGITGDEQRIGKPVFSDIREGKRTTIVLKSWEAASPEQRELMTRTLGNHTATSADVGKVAKLFQELGGVEHTQDLARQYLDDAISDLEQLSPLRDTSMLLAWADFMLMRNH